MKTKEIRDLIDFISQTGLNEVNIETEELKLSVKRDPDVQTRYVEASAPAISTPAPVQASAPAPTQTPAQATSAPAKSTEDTGKYLEVKSPMIGTFYRSPNPDSPPFVAVGDKIEKGQPVCIIEAMKLFNEIESEVSGTIVKVVVENASPVEYDQVLFLVDPS
ncbi:Biotin carboxyl carrier protein of acetyl-CoA carboxylase [Fulvivirga imtechensis AK7]|uniref:Biotin carboxyl carrier protein of acetyl-CoA carboxylase n=1 Tax=Fulvivirga imtechensis AK7 TaxID=1237149 RepID=L8JL52_9BACT|nr:acetyl-CoA carboxylase biotin carboxyl carrier protein [Fulvivirga imtechensis]ELR68214.1 Biotin carboxyl carrier protein of acetyl-CoA carboxylase [Fulvivirga imtechensis AK7]